jgi:predicted butyrate kinase (DUF1464 family)
MTIPLLAQGTVRKWRNAARIPLNISDDTLFVIIQKLDITEIKGTEKEKIKLIKEQLDLQ